MRMQHQPALSQRPIRTPGFLHSDAGQEATKSRWSWLRSGRLGPDLHPAHSGYVVCLAGLSGRRRDHSEDSGLQTRGAFHVGRGDVFQVARIQSRAFFPSGSTHCPSPVPTPKRTQTQKTFATLLIYSGFLPLSQWSTSCRTPE